MWGEVVHGKIENGTFHLQDLQTALKIAKDGDEILIHPGDYLVKEFIAKKSITLIGTERNKVNIITPLGNKTQEKKTMKIMKAMTPKLR